MMRRLRSLWTWCRSRFHRPAPRWTAPPPVQKPESVREARAQLSLLQAQAIKAACVDAGYEETTFARGHIDSSMTVDDVSQHLELAVAAIAGETPGTGGRKAPGGSHRRPPCMPITTGSTSPRVTTASKAQDGGGQ